MLPLKVRLEIFVEVDEVRLCFAEECRPKCGCADVIVEEERG